jgi:hypothetical protein
MAAGVTLRPGPVWPVPLVLFRSASRVAARAALCVPLHFSSPVAFASAALVLAFLATLRLGSFLSVLVVPPGQLLCWPRAELRPSQFFLYPLVCEVVVGRRWW